MVHKQFAMRLVVLFGLFIFLTDLTGPQISLSAADDNCATDRLKNSTACNAIQGFAGNEALNNVDGVTIAGGGEIDLPSSCWSSGPSRRCGSSARWWARRSSSAGCA